MHTLTDTWLRIASSFYRQTNGSKLDLEMFFLFVLHIPGMCSAECCSSNSI